jgi:uncharacterized membrane protein
MAVSDLNSPAGVALVIVGAAVVLALANQAPAVLIVLTVLAFLGWVGVRSGLLARDEESDAADTPAGDDPPTILQQRYASGEITKAEFERRVDELLEVDARATVSERETATERR